MKRYFIYLVVIISTNFTSAQIPTKSNLTKLYIATFKRAPDAAGLNYWLNSSGLRLEEIAQSFFEQSETKRLYPSSYSNYDFIEAVYKNLFDREPDSAGWRYWVDELDNGYIPRSKFILAVINGAMGDDARILSNREKAGEYFANKGLNDSKEAYKVVSMVNKTISSLNRAVKYIDELVSSKSNRDKESGITPSPLPDNSSNDTTTTNTTQNNTIEDNNVINLTSMQQYEKRLSFKESGEYRLENAPKGMAVYPNGTLSWTPTNDQEGDYIVTINLVDNGNIADSKEMAFHVTDSNISYDGLFVDLSGVKKRGEGTPQNPYGTYEEACENLNGKSNIYIRGGVYKNPGYHKDYSKKGRYPAITDKCQGTKDNPIVVRPWGNEYVKLKTDALYGIKVKPNANYITIENFDIEGEAKDITLQTALKYWWWDRNDTMQSGGIGVNGDNIVIKNNVIHDMPGSGISVTNGRYAKIVGNIVYNCDWWTIAGSKGVGITLAQGDDAEGEYKNQIVGNLIFNIEQRVFSHVWAKKFATLTIDEGEAFLIQEGKQQDDTNSSGYNGRYLIKDNLILYNGKSGVVNLAKNVDLINNSYYNNGGATKQAGFRVSHSKDINILNNAVEADIEDTIIYSVDRASSDINLSNNYAKGVITKGGDAIEGIESVEEIFNEPEQFDFSIVADLPQNIGVSKEVIEDIKSKLELYNIQVKRDHLEVDKVAQTKYIVEHAPGKIDCSHYSDEKPYITITDINSSHRLVTDVHTTKFKLYIKYKYGECKER